MYGGPMNPAQEQIIDPHFPQALSLKPFLPFEVKDHGPTDEDDDSPDHGISQRPFQFRHHFEIHSVNACNEGQGDKDGGNDGRGPS